MDASVSGVVLTNGASTPPRLLFLSLSGLQPTRVEADGIRRQRGRFLMAQTQRAQKSTA